MHVLLQSVLRTTLSVHTILVIILVHEMQFALLTMETNLVAKLNPTSLLVLELKSYQENGEYTLRLTLYREPIHLHSQTQQI